MARHKEFIGYVTATCKKCKKAFIFFDQYGEWNDEPPTKFYCPECEKLGFKNKKGRETPEDFLNGNNITNKGVRNKFKKIFREHGKGRTYKSILKEAIELEQLLNEGQEIDGI